MLERLLFLKVHFGIYLALFIAITFKSKCCVTMVLCFKEMRSPDTSYAILIFCIKSISCCPCCVVYQDMSRAPFAWKMCKAINSYFAIVAKLQKVYHARIIIGFYCWKDNKKKKKHLLITQEPPIKKTIIDYWKWWFITLLHDFVLTNENNTILFLINHWPIYSICIVCAI